MRLIVPMGGRGTRLRPLSHTTPKALLPVAGRSAIERSLAAFADALARPVDEVVFVLNPADRAGGVPDQLAAVAQRVGVAASFAVQDLPLGTAHAVGAAGDKLDGEVLTVWSDTLFRAERPADLSGHPDLIAWTFDVADPRRFGVVARDSNGVVTGFVEKPTDAGFTETLIGAYYIRDGAALRGQIDRMMAVGRTGAGGEYQLTDALDGLVQGGARVRTERVAEWLDVGTVPAYLDAVARTLDHEGRRPPDLLGVTVIPPVYVGPGTTILASTIGPYVSIEEGAVIEESTLTATVVFAGGSVRGAEVSGGVVGQRASVQGTRGSVMLGDDASVGVPVAARSPLAGSEAVEPLASEQPLKRGS